MKRAKAGVPGSVLAIGLMLVALLAIGGLLATYSLSSSIIEEGGERARKEFDRKREGLRVYISNAFFAPPGGPRSVRWGSPWLYIIVDGGYAVSLKSLLFLVADASQTSNILVFQLNKTIEPPCVAINLRKIDNRWKSLEDLNKSITHVAVVTSSGKVYYSTIGTPPLTAIYPCIYDIDRNAFDVKVQASPANAMDRIFYEVVKGSCTESRQGNRLALRCSDFAIVKLWAPVLYWQVEGVKTEDNPLYLFLIEDYNVVAKFD